MFSGNEIRAALREAKNTGVGGRVDNTMYSQEWGEFQDKQQAQVAGCRDYYTNAPATRVHVVDGMEEPLERSRLYGPFNLEVVRWAQMCPYITLGTDADGREYVEY